jgi:hypothetical protein
MSTAGACASPGCTSVVSQRLACPKCIQLGMLPTYFCSQDCFKQNYSNHKSLHALAKQIIAANSGYVIVCRWVVTVSEETLELVCRCALLLILIFSSSFDSGVNKLTERLLHPMVSRAPSMLLQS